MLSSLPRLAPRVPLRQPSSQSCTRKPRVVARASDGTATDDEGRGTNLGRYCSIDGSGKQGKDMSLAEKESLFLDALSGYYYDGEPRLSDEEFETLKDELLWSGSKVAVLTSAEQRFLEASIAYTKGKPILDDTEFDDLKQELRAQNSTVTLSGPRCSIRSKRLYSDASPDYLKLTLLNLPAALIVLGFIFAIDDFTGFEITKAIELPPPYSILFLWGLVFPSIYVVASSITNFVLPEALILKADCPSCGEESQAYFGGIFTVAGNKRTSVVECRNCLADLEFGAQKRQVTVVKSSDEKKQAADELEKKRAASAAKKAAKAKAKAGKE